MFRTKRAASAASSSHEESPTKKQRMDGTDAYVTTVDLSAADPAVRERVRSHASYRLMPDCTALGGQTPVSLSQPVPCPAGGLRRACFTNRLQDDLPLTLLLTACTL